MHRLSIAEFLSMVTEDKENIISLTLFIEDRLEDVMMDVFVHDSPFIHDNALFVAVFLFSFFR